MYESDQQYEWMAAEIVATWMIFRVVAAAFGAMVAAIAALVCAAVYDVHLALALVVIGGLFARMAVSSHRRADAILARAMAADLAEGADAPEQMAEAA